MIIPEKLRVGDEIRIVSTSDSMSLVPDHALKIAEKRLQDMGFKITYGKHVNEINELETLSIKSRLEDLHKAFEDKNVNAIITSNGGLNSNQLLKHVDYNTIKANPKILCGFSDNTAMINTITKKTGIVTYSGPDFFSFGMKHGFDYTKEYFKKCLLSSKPFNINPSDVWSDDKWEVDQEKREFIKNSGFVVINKGSAEGTSIGGNISTLSLLQGTQFMPSLKNAVIFVEDTFHVTPPIFDRYLQSLIHIADFENASALLIGRFQKASKMSIELLKKIIHTKHELDDIPVVADIDFGHTEPFFTFPIGGLVMVSANKTAEIKILEH